MPACITWYPILLVESSLPRVEQTPGWWWFFLVGDVRLKRRDIKLVSQTRLSDSRCQIEPSANRGPTGSRRRCEQCRQKMTARRFSVERRSGRHVRSAGGNNERSSDTRRCESRCGAGPNRLSDDGRWEGDNGVGVGAVTMMAAFTLWLVVEGRSV